MTEREDIEEEGAMDQTDPTATIEHLRDREITLLKGAANWRGAAADARKVGSVTEAQFVFVAGGMVRSALRL